VNLSKLNFPGVANHIRILMEADSNRNSQPVLIFAFLLAAGRYFNVRI
jgi:hypothetical protein